jgi:lipopolysaccharide transport system ATP-binding protein
MSSEKLSYLVVDNLWKRYRIPHKKKESILEYIASSLEFFESKTTSYEEFWALKGVSFKLRQGESLGILGRNGSGKSTLLKLIARTIKPTLGTIHTEGKIAPILELGLGFHPELSVKDNAKIYASLMGIRNRDIRQRLDKVLEFAEIGNFADAKLKNLSSGMQMRLAFAVAIESNPSLFVIDEALSVGDVAFQTKCLDKFRDFQRDGCSIIMVSQSPQLISDFCHRALIMNRGEVAFKGDTRFISERYNTFLSEETAQL